MPSWFYPSDIPAWDGTPEDAHRIASQGRICDTCPDGWVSCWKEVGQDYKQEPTEALPDAPKRRGRPPKVKQ